MRRLFLSIRRYARLFGFARGLVALVLLTVLPRIHRPSRTLPLPVPGSSRWVRARCGTTDRSAFREVFLSDNYVLDHTLAPAVVIDAGANVGYASILFAQTWPEARVIAVEPDESNYALLLRNTHGLGQVEPVQAALWGERVPLAIVNPKGPKMALRVAEAKQGTGFVTLTMEDLLAQAGVGSIDVLKLDIEGAEHNLFTRDPGCLDHVRFLMVELHDRYVPGCSEAFFKALGRHNHHLSEHGDTLHVWFEDQ